MLKGFDKMKELIIGKPYIKDLSTGYVRLCADISINSEVKTLYYEVEDSYKEYLCYERVDAFACSLIVRAMETGLDIVSEAPITDSLLYQLENYYIPILSDNRPDLHKITINCPLIKEQNYNAKGVATGLSGGVDSFYSIIKHLNQRVESRKITHAIFTNIATLDNDDARIREWFDIRSKKMEIVAKKLHLSYISIYTNMYKFYPFPYHSYSFYFSPLYISNAYALQKLIRIFYHSSGVTLNEFSLIKAGDNAYFDLFNVKCFSSNQVIVYSTGTELGRMEKLRTISSNKTVQENLSVCAQEVTGKGFVDNTKLNCGVCNKCMRTVTELYAIGCLKDFEDIFDLKVFNKNIGKYIAKTTCINGHSFNNEYLNELKKKNLLPKTYYFYKALYSPIYHIKNINFLRKNTFVRYLYYKFDIDKKLNGYRPDTDDGKNWRDSI